MIHNVVTSIILYSGTAVDLLIILMLFFAKRKSRKDIINIYLGQFLGSVSLILLSLLFAFVLNYIPSKEILGLLGLIPIFLGLKVLLLGDSDGEAIAKDGLLHHFFFLVSCNHSLVEADSQASLDHLIGC